MGRAFRQWTTSPIWAVHSHARWTLMLKSTTGLTKPALPLGDSVRPFGSGEDSASNHQAEGVPCIGTHHPPLCQWDLDCLKQARQTPAGRLLHIKWQEDPRHGGPGMGEHPQRLHSPTEKLSPDGLDTSPECLTVNCQSSCCMENCSKASTLLGSRRNTLKTAQSVPQSCGHQSQHLGISSRRLFSLEKQDHHWSPHVSTRWTTEAQRKCAASKAWATSTSIAESSNKVCPTCGRASRPGLASLATSDPHSQILILKTKSWSSSNTMDKHYYYVLNY